jgi:hypothetical protein
MPQKKNKPRSVSQLEAVRRVRKELPPPMRRKEDEKKYRRTTVQRETRKEVERASHEE